MGADEDRDRERHAEGGADHGPEHQATDEEAGVDMAASLVGAGAIRGDATAGHPSKQLGHRQATSQARIDGRSARRLAGPRHPATRPPI
jgi:hypothetical protein